MPDIVKLEVYFRKTQYDRDKICGEVADYLRMSGLDLLTPISPYAITDACDYYRVPVAIECAAHNTVSAILSAFPNPADDIYEDCHIHKMEVTFNP